MARSIASILRQARTEAGLTQMEVARRAGLAANHIVRLESGKKVALRFETLAKLAAALGLSLDQIAIERGLREQWTLPPLDFAPAINLSKDLRGLNEVLLTAADHASEVADLLLESAGSAERPKRKGRRRKS